MNEIKRRKLLFAAQDKAEKKISAVLVKHFSQRFKQLKRDIRKMPPFRKQLAKSGGVYDLRKDTLNDWREWIRKFNLDIIAALLLMTGDIFNVEDLYFLSNGFPPNAEFNIDQFIQDYQTNIGQYITDIGQATLEATQSEIVAWYQSEGSLSDLITSLEKYYSPARAAMIARTETNKLSSAIAAQEMRYYGITQWQWNSIREDNTCEFCLDMHGQIFNLDDEMPPDAAHPNCACYCTYVYDGVT